MASRQCITRPLFDHGYAGTLQSMVWETFGRDGKMLDILATAQWNLS
jgi:hypothetical protein